MCILGNQKIQEFYFGNFRFARELCSSVQIERLFENITKNGEDRRIAELCTGDDEGFEVHMGEEDRR